MKMLSLGSIVFIVLLSGCSSSSNDTELLGADRDANNCIASAGYSWCENTNQCERSWELAEQEGFENTVAEFKKYCKG